MKNWTKVLVFLILLFVVGLVVYMKYYHNPDPDDPDNYIAFVENFDISDYGEPDYVGTGRQGHSMLPLSRHAYYSLDLDRDILKDAKSVEFKFQYFDDRGCSREHYRIRNLDTGCYDSRIDYKDIKGIHGKEIHIYSYTYKHIWMVPASQYDNPYSIEERLMGNVEILDNDHLFIVSHWDGLGKIVLYDLVDKIPVGYYYDIAVDPDLPDHLFDGEDVYKECEI